MLDLLPGLAWRLPLAFAVLLATLWGGLALWFRGPASRRITAALIAGWSLPGVAALCALLLPSLSGPRTAALTVFGVGFAALCLWWLSIRPSQARDWSPDVARLLDAEVDGDRVTLHNVRCFAWRTREDFTARWETRHYDLATLRSVDLIVSYWMGPTIAHTLVSFGFDDGRQLAFSVEVRRTRGQLFSAVGGFFKQSELVLIAADERDIVRTRSNVRGEAVYLYRVGMPAAAMRDLFHAYLDEAGSLQRAPRFYDSLSSNCTTLVFKMVRRIVPGLPLDRRLLLSGHLPEYIYDLGALDTSRPFAELRARGHINARALASDSNGQASASDDDTSAAFSRAIRRGVPDPDGQLSDAV